MSPRLPASVILALVTGACARPESTPPPSSGSAAPARACFLLYEMGVGEVRRSPSEGCSTRVTPASTFKVPHALAALDSGIVAGPDVNVRWLVGHVEREQRSWVFVSCVTGSGLDPLAAVNLAATSLRTARVL
jgi:beta-lactamase class D